MSAMSETGSPSYDRTPSRSLRGILMADGFLAPLLVKRRVDGIVLETHLRPEDEVHLYCGLTRLVNIALTGGSVSIKSHKTYTNQPCARRLFRPGQCKEVNGGDYLLDEWTVGEPGFASALETFLSSVEVASTQKKEGAIQARWSQIREPWIAFDKEAALSYPSEEERERQLCEAFSPWVDEARSELSALASRSHWKELPSPKKRLELDQIAVDPSGNLVLLEIKDSSVSSAEVYYAPFQLLHNVCEWHLALEAVRGSLQQLLDARVELGLTPGDLSPLSGGIRAAVGFGDDDRSDEVRRRYAEVLGIVNEHLPSVPQIETWAFAQGKTPVQIS